MHKNSYCFVFLGIQLIERNEEVCVLYEKINVQGSVIRNGDMEMQSREEEMRFLKMEASDLRRQIDLLKGLLSVNIPILFKNLKTKITYGLFGLAKSLHANLSFHNITYKCVDVFSSLDLILFIHFSHLPILVPK